MRKNMAVQNPTNSITLIVAAAVITAAMPAVAADSLGLYIGGGIGQSHVRANEDFGVTPLGSGGAALGFDEQHSAWKLVMGVRPIPLFGAELEYLDFGHPSALLGAQQSLFNVQADAHARAAALFGVVYAPTPLPLLDIYGKAGLARLQTSVNARFVCNAGGDCPPVLFIVPLSVNQTSTRFAYGAGVQVKLPAFGLGVEYERINSSGGDPDFLSFEITWHF